MKKAPEREDPKLERVPSSVEGLDTILRGGFLRGGVYIIQGVPGAGKTILGNQIMHGHVAAGGRGLYVTLLAETHARMLLHLGRMRWFQADAIPSSLAYVSALRMLEQDGLRGLLAVIRREVQAQRASILVLDGFVAAEAAAATQTEFKKFIQELQVQAGITDCTIFLLTSAGGDVVSPEHTMVDGVVELGDEPIGFRSERALTIHKFRGSGFLRGRHPFRITEDGLIVYPRFEALYARPSHLAEPLPKRIRFGIAQLDRMLGGGLPEGTTTAIVGPSGTGKTLLSLQFVAGASASQPGLFFGFFETPPRLLEIAGSIGIDLAEKVRREHVEMIWQPPTEDIMDALGHRLVDAVRRRRVRRLAVDGLGGFIETAADPGRISRFFAALSNELRGLGVTALYTLETRDMLGSSLMMPINGVSSLIESLIFLRYAEYRAETHRVLSVMKVRSSSFDPALREFVVDGQGIHLADSFEGAKKILSGNAEEASRSPRAPRLPPARKRGK